MVIAGIYFETARIASMSYDQSSKCAVFLIRDAHSNPVCIPCSENEYIRALESIRNYHGSVPPKRKGLLRFFW
jgi:hypothetical protein